MSPRVERRPFRIAAAVVFGILAVAGIFYLGRRSAGPEEAGAGAPRAGIVYHCPMHPAMTSDRPGDCPICGMRMIPSEGAAQGSPPAPPGGAAPSARRRVIYRSTMNPGEVSDRPGKDSMGMEMEPVEVDDGHAGVPAIEGQAAIRITPRKQQLIGVRTSPLHRGPLVRTIRAVGRVTADEARLHHVHTKFEGWIEALYVSSTGVRVERGQPLLSIYSPELVASQEEYLVALRARRTMGEGRLPDAAGRAADLVESGRRRLLLYDFTPEQIDRLEATGTAMRTMTLYSPITGYVTERKVTQGERIDASTTLLDIADLSTVWVLASVYEYELPFIKVGQRAEVTLSYLPGTRYQGRVGVVYPVLEASTRTVQVRLDFPNPDLNLKPEMYADVEIRSDLGDRLIIPDSAVVSSGTRSIVFVAQGDGYFAPREVRLGFRLPDGVEVLGGLKEGDEVVTSGNFLIDSESKLKAALESAAAPTATAPSPATGAPGVAAPPDGPR